MRSRMIPLIVLVSTSCGSSTPTVPLPTGQMTLGFRPGDRPPLAMVVDRGCVGRGDIVVVSVVTDPQASIRILMKSVSSPGDVRDYVDVPASRADGQFTWKLRIPKDLPSGPADISAEAILRARKRSPMRVTSQTATIDVSDRCASAQSTPRPSPVEAHAP